MLKKMTQITTIPPFKWSISCLLCLLLITTGWNAYTMYSLFGEQVLLHYQMYFLLWVTCFILSFHQHKLVAYIIAAASVWYWPYALAGAFYDLSPSDWQSAFVLSARIAAIIEIILFLLAYLIIFTLLSTAVTKKAKDIAGA